MIEILTLGIKTLCLAISLGMFCSVVCWSGLISFILLSEVTKKVFGVK